MSEREPHWWHTNGVLNNVTRKRLPQIKWFILFLARAFAPIMNDHIGSFNSQPLIFVSMAPKLSDLAEETFGASLQVDSQVEEPTQGVKDLWESEEDDSSPSHSPLWSPARRLLSSHPNMKYCLEIQITLTEELGFIPPPSHS